MFTLIGLTKRSDNDFDNAIYEQIARVSALATCFLLASLLLLVVLAISVDEFANVPVDWFPMFYKILFALVIGVTALLAGTIVMLYFTVRQVFAGVTPGDAV